MIVLADRRCTRASSPGFADETIVFAPRLDSAKTFLSTKSTLWKNVFAVVSVKTSSQTSSQPPSRCEDVFEEFYSFNLSENKWR